MTTESVVRQVRVRRRLLWVQVHRLSVFERTFSAYLRGEATAGQVAMRAKKFLEVGLPGALPRHRRRVSAVERG